MNYNCFTDEERYFQIIIRDPNSPFKAMSKESQIISPLSLLNYSCLKLIQYLRNKNIKCSAVLKV